MTSTPPFETRLLEMRNLPTWYEAFGVPPASKPYLPPATRLSVW